MEAKKVEKVNEYKVAESIVILGVKDKKIEGTGAIKMPEKEET